MPRAKGFQLLPYSYVVGQRELCQMLELSYIVPSIGGVLISGERGTAKSTIVRSFARMVYDELPVTLPINATDDRVLGGWEIRALLKGEPRWKRGVLEQAGKNGILYIDEVNLLDDHITNMILDVASTGVLVLEREGMNRQHVNLSFNLVGTMNPEEGALRPQLLDRFGLHVPISAEADSSTRRHILLTVMRFEEERTWPRSEWLDRGSQLDSRRREKLKAARERVPAVPLTNQTAILIGRIAASFNIAGHRGELVMAQAARALAALSDRLAVEPGDVRQVARFAIMHRRREIGLGEPIEWHEKDNELLASVLAET